jgi:hypothetical protein
MSVRVISDVLRLATPGVKLLDSSGECVMYARGFTIVKTGICYTDCLALAFVDSTALELFIIRVQERSGNIVEECSLFDRMDDSHFVNSGKSLQSFGINRDPDHA